MLQAQEDPLPLSDIHNNSDTLDNAPQQDDIIPLGDLISLDEIAALRSADSLRIADSTRVADSLRLCEADSLRAAYEANALRMRAQALQTLQTSWVEWSATQPVDSAALQALTEQPKTAAARKRAAQEEAQRQAVLTARIDSMKQAAARQAEMWGDASDAMIDFRMPLIASSKLASVEPLPSYSEVVATPTSTRATTSTTQANLTASTDYLTRTAQMNRDRQQFIDDYVTDHPFQHHYLRGRMQKAPEKEKMKTDNLLQGHQVEVAGFNMDFQNTLKGGKPSADKWHYHGYSTYQMTQTAMSDNWYKGGENNMTIYSDQKLEIKRYDAEKITTFETTLQLKLGFYYTQADTIHSMRVNDNQFSLDVKYGYKAWKRWYYSASATFKTPIFNYYPANSHKVKSAFLSPAELNVNLGTDYSYANKKKTVSYSLLLAPLSYYMKYVDNQKVSVTQYGIDADHRVLNQIGSSLTSKLSWKISNSVQWESRLYMFTSYESFLGEFENTFTFRVNRYLSANIMLYPRIDDSTTKDPWQMKEMLTFGFNYVWK
jgi:hypothetical protein